MSSFIEWGKCDAYCEHWGICWVSGPHDIHDTGTHKFSEEERMVVEEEKNDEAKSGN